MSPLITPTLLLLSTIAKAVMDHLRFTDFYAESKLPRWFSKWGFLSNRGFYNWWDNHSYRNKYKNKVKEQGPAFWGSTTFFVFTTDAWHFFQFLFLNLLFLGIVFYQPMFNLVLDFLCYRLLYSIIFEICYTHLKIKSKWNNGTRFW